LRVKGVGQYGKHAAAKNAGFQKEDVIVAIAGMQTRLTEGQYLGRILQAHQAGAKLDTTVLRGEQRVELKLPMQ
jgi:type II secretory pathway component PulC